MASPVFVSLLRGPGRSGRILRYITGVWAEYHGQSTARRPGRLVGERYVSLYCCDYLPRATGGEKLVEHSRFVVSFI